MLSGTSSSLPINMMFSAGTTPTAEFGGLNLVDNRFGGHLGKRLDQGLIAAGGHVMRDVGGIDPAAVGRHAALLYGVSRDLVEVKAP
jgi:hypothetical protein